MKQTFKLGSLSISKLTKLHTASSCPNAITRPWINFAIRNRSTRYSFHVIRSIGEYYVYLKRTVRLFCTANIGKRKPLFAYVDDFGNLINPMLAEGQVHGGVGQGIGQALTEHVVHDAHGQLLTASLMDYALPRAAEIPMIKFTSVPVPSTSNPMGMKGCGEAGTVGALAAVANAVQDALWDHGVRQADMPFTPHKVWELLTHESVAAK